MEVRINREIRDYTESMFFGLSLRQFFFSVLACGVAVGIYLGLNPILGTETTSWLCIVAAFPFAVMGFLKYNGMTAERFIMAWIKSTFMIPKVLLFGNTNYYYAMFADESEEHGKKKPFHRRGSRHKRYTTRRQGVKTNKQKKRRKGADGN
ncbi:MAG: PrgI family protein [Mogibacterium sp.]|nr:PrgI family protein [Mogibacterium sp.]